MINLDKFHFKIPIQLRWNDMDALGHVNNAMYITYFEHGRGVYMLKACQGWDWHKHMFLIGKVDAIFYKELRLTAKNPEVWVRTSKLGNKSFEIEYAVTSQKGEETIIHASGSSTQIMFDTHKRHTIEIEDWVRQKLSTFDKIPTGN